LNLEELNKLDETSARMSLSQCCGAEKWVKAMVASRPFLAREQLFEKANKCFDTLSDSDWLEAYTHHPRIGDVESLREKFASTAAWASKEQGSVSDADEAVILELKNTNDKYFDRYGFIFIVCATGKSASEMLEILNSRMENDNKSEIQIAADEQKKITNLRMEKLLS
jgi:2-oxo-4-hydroxy-4-carboxy-5-ureidoimidazoline decarboxylase